MKKSIRRRVLKGIAIALACVVLVAGLLFVAQIEMPTRITSPEQDAQRVEELAERVYSEASLRDVETLCNEIEIAYRERYDGATAQRFVTLVEPIRRDAEARREAVRQAEDEVKALEDGLNESLNKLTNMWCVDLNNKSANKARMNAINEEIATIEAKKNAVFGKIAELSAKMWELSDDLNSEAYKAVMRDMKAEQKKMEGYDAQIKALAEEYDAIVMAYRVRMNIDILQE